MTLRAILSCATLTVLGLATFVYHKPEENGTEPKLARDVPNGAAISVDDEPRRAERQAVSPADVQSELTAMEPSEQRHSQAEVDPLLVDRRFLLYVDRIQELPLSSYMAGEAVLSQFASETRDSGWSNTTESMILDKIAQVGSLRGLAHIDVECKTTLCRVQLVSAGVRRPTEAHGVPVMAAVQMSALIREIEMSDDLGLRPVMGRSGFDDHGTPITLFYLQKQ